MFYRLKFFTIVTLVFSLTYTVGAAQSRTGEIVQVSPKAETQTTQPGTEGLVHLLQLGERQLNKNQFQEALGTFQAVLTVVRLIKERQLEARTLHNIGIVYREMKNYPQALEFYQQALAVRIDVGNRRGQGITLNDIGLVYYNQKQYTKALEFYQQALAIHKEVANKADEGTTLDNIGLVYYNQKQYTKVLEFYQQALAIHKEVANKADEGKTLHNIGVVYREMKNYPQALEFYQQALAVRIDVGNRRGQGITLNDIGLVYYNQKQYTKALEFYQQALAIHKEVINKVDEGTTLDNIGLVYNKQKDYPKALNYYQQALANRQELKNKVGQANILKHIVEVYQNQYQYPNALKVLNQILAIRQENGDKKGQISVLLDMGNIYKDTGKYAKALRYFEQTLAIAKTIENKEERIKYEFVARGFMAVLKPYLGQVMQFSDFVPEPVSPVNKDEIDNFSQTSDFNQQVDVIAKEVGANGKDIKGLVDYSNERIASYQKDLDNAAKQGKIPETYILYNSGKFYNAIGQYNRAQNFYQQALAASKRSDEKEQGEILNYIGVTYYNQGEYIKALDFFQQSVMNLQSTVDIAAQGFALNNMGATYSALGQDANAEKKLFNAINIFESLRLGLTDDQKISIFDAQIRTYRNLQEVLIAQNKSKEALEISERGRSRAFVELLTSRLSGKNISQIVEKPTLSLLQEIAKQQNATLVEYSIIGDGFKIQNKQETHKSELYIWVIKPTGEVTFRKADFKPLLQQQNISLRDKVAQTRQSIVQGVNVTNRSHKITLTPGDRVKFNDDDPDWEAWQVVSVDIKNGKITIRLPSWEAEKPAIERPIADVAKKIGINSSGANAKNLQLQELYQLLIQPIADILPKEETARLIFIPQDALFLVPFPALQDPSGQYLIDKHTILTAPSIQVLVSTHKLRQKVPGSAKDILVVGNPTMPKISKNPGESPKQLSALPGSEKEALAIASFWKTQALIGNQATKNAVLQKLPLAKIIHLATHGLLDDIRGLGSSIVFAPEGQDNGLLTAEDILNLYTAPQGSTLSAELVVLSACDTGQGRLTGDGVIGLSRSIIAAGVPSVIVSLWSIPDAPTAELMTEFYENFRKNPDKADALRQAMLTTKKKHPNPAEWAAFTLIGESK
ncbi:tetratricopeptide repeat protein [Nostoc sp. CALU 546]|uniref:tetratricopeptide repeat protein n=1 Tax=Nostoc sp. CALU 546 TaxID=1867241 RepID=UPI003B66EB3D